MKWIIHYDIVALLLISAILIAYLLFNHLKTFQNKVYKFLLIIALLSAIFDIVAAITCSFFTKEQNTLNYAVNISHFILQNLVPCVYCLFVYSMAHETGQMSKNWKLIIFLPYVFIFFLIVTTPVTKACFYFDENGIYHRGSGQIFAYLVAFYYVILSCFIVFKNLKILGKPQRFAVLIYSVEIFCLTLIQLLFPKYLLQEIAIAFAMFFIYITIQNPLESIDVQTGAYNRNLFKKTLNIMLQNKEDYTIICVLIDGLGYINEKFGIQNGNNVLKQIVNLFLSFNKNFNVFRISNRQFAIVIPDRKNNTQICDEIIERFNRPFKLEDINVYVNMSCYLCYLINSENICSINDIFDIIDYSLDEAQHIKKNMTVVASADVLEKRRREIQITRAISDAITNRSFEVYYQPIYSLEDKCYTNMEALVRLNNTPIGNIPPDEFISIAEKNGDILAIGEIVLEKVCAFIKEHHPEQMGIKGIHVNLSVVQCMQENIYSRLMKIIDRYNISHGLIDFEITESTADNTSDNIGRIMTDFGKNGIHFSLDDYGTGYSNQSNLMKYPYSIVKIDKSMIWACDTNPKASISLKYTIAMIKDLDMAVLAEGIETEKQKEFLIEIGCEYFQGYYFSRPVEENELIEIIKNNQIVGEVK